TADLLNILNQTEEASAQGLPVKYTQPSWEVIYNKERKGRPFIDAAIGVREMMLLQPLTRQVLFQRFNYTVPHYGKIHEASTFKTSQVTHMGLVIQDDSKEILQFYEDILGLLRVRDDVETTYESSEAGRKIFDLQPNERFLVTAFDDPRSSKSDWKAARSGRLYIIRFPESVELEHRLSEALPGCLGLSLYTYRVRDLEDYFNRVKASGVQNITDILANEFGEQSFSFIAPDGYFWTLISG
ncbi:MAG TPA: VOC family protein, partial [Cyanophyceae cyanobacterium]